MHRSWLYKLRLVDRFQLLDHRYASLSYHYVLDELGDTVIAAERGEDPHKSRWRADNALAIGRSQRLAHLVGVNGFFSALLAESRHRENCDLSLWWSERHCANQFDRIAQPDGLGVSEESGNRVVFCLEYDRSTETLERLEKKLKSSYVDLQLASGLAYWICLCFRHPRREAGARRVLAKAAVPVATAALGPTQRPHEAIWARLATRASGCDLPRCSASPSRPSPGSESQSPRRTDGGKRNGDGRLRRDGDQEAPASRIVTPPGVGTARPAAAPASSRSASGSRPTPAPASGTPSAHLLYRCT